MVGLGIAVALNHSGLESAGLTVLGCCYRPLSPASGDAQGGGAPECELWREVQRWQVFLVFRYGVTEILLAGAKPPYAVRIESIYTINSYYLFL